MPVSASSKSSTLSTTESNSSASKKENSKDVGFGALLQGVSQVSIVGNSMVSHQFTKEAAKKPSSSSSPNAKSLGTSILDSKGASPDKPSEPHVLSSHATLAGAGSLIDQVQPGSNSTSSSMVTQVGIETNVPVPTDGRATLSTEQSPSPASPAGSKGCEPNSLAAPMNGTQSPQSSIAMQNVQPEGLRQESTPQSSSRSNLGFRASTAQSVSQQGAASLLLAPSAKAASSNGYVSQESLNTGSGVLNQWVPTADGSQTLGVEAIKSRLQTGTPKGTLNSGASVSNNQETAAVVLNTPISFPTLPAAVSSSTSVSVGAGSYVPLDQLANVVAAHMSDNPALPSTIHLRIFPKDLGVLNVHLSGVEGSIAIKLDGTSMELGSQLNSAMGQLAKELQAALSVKVSLNLGSFGTNQGGNKNETSYEVPPVGSRSISALSQLNRPSNQRDRESQRHVVDLRA